jgi:hypothetical protein
MRRSFIEGSIVRFFAFVVLSVCCSAGAAQEQTIDPDWVYVSSLTWKHVNDTVKSQGHQSAFAEIVVLYPDGEYVEVASLLVRANRKNPPAIAPGEGFIIRMGRWTRIDDDLVRLESKEVLREKVVEKAGSHTSTPTNYNCKLERMGRDRHLAGTILCADKILTPLLALESYGQLRQLVQDGRNAQKAPSSR